ncbi:MAG: tetratricopeptide repeat protein, partial [Candidatus Neomarinimicrobiota bacterium]
YRDSGLLTQAITTYQKAIEADPALHRPYSNMGFILIDNDMDVEEGLRLLETALVSSPENPSHLHRKGWGLYKQGRYTEALEVLERAWELRPSYNHEHFQHLQAARKAVAGEKR